MSWLIGWNSGLLDEIELVYQKAEKNEGIENELCRLEEQALIEAAHACSPGGLFAQEIGQVLTQEQFENLSEIDKETSIVMLSQKGLNGFDFNRGNATLIVKLSTNIQETLACTIFGLLNRIEKLDGSAQVTSPKWKMELLVPLGGRKNLMRWEMLIMQLYPWISIQESSSGESAIESNVEKVVRNTETKAQKKEEESENLGEGKQSEQEKNSEAGEKLSLIQKLKKVIEILIS